MRGSAKNVLDEVADRGAIAERRHAGGLWVVYVTAVIEGASVIVIEIAGARALAPFFGTSLQVWTAQITATLFFLAIGYGLGGLLAQKNRSWTPTVLFAVAGIWMAAYPLWRTAVLDACAGFGVAMGSLCGAAILFGMPLTMLGAVSPVMVALIDSHRPGAGSAAGRLFFTNTMGGLVGGWLTAFVLIPYASLRLSLAATGAVLLLLGAAWSIIGRSFRVGIAAMALAGAAIALLWVQPARPTADKFGRPIKVLYTHQSGVGLVQVIDFPDTRLQLIDGVIQGDMDLARGVNAHGYIHSQQILTYAFHPHARTALQLGLGPGLLAKELAERGMDVTAVELDPRIAEVARRYFGFPQRVPIFVQDARDFLRRDSRTWDLIYLDAFHGENTPWHLMTIEAMAAMKGRLNPGGRVIINAPAYAAKPSMELARIESAALRTFGQAMVIPEPDPSGNPDALVNVHIVAGGNLQANSDALPVGLEPAMLGKLLGGSRRASAAAEPTTDDRSDLDYLESPYCIEWRKLIWDNTQSSLLGD